MGQNPHLYTSLSNFSWTFKTLIGGLLAHLSFFVTIKASCNSVSKKTRLGMLQQKTKISAMTSLVAQWLGLSASTAWGTGSVPGQGTKIPHAMWNSQKIK